MERMMSNEPGLTDKIALVFGGSRGIGAAIVKQLAADGASVALTYAKSADRAAETAREAEALGVLAVMIKADSAHPAPRKEAHAQTAARFRRPENLVLDACILTRGLWDPLALECFE